MKNTAFALLLSLGLTSLSAQQFVTRNGTVEFLSETPVENIEAINNQVSSVLDLDKNQFAFLVPIKAFKFEKALMEEHFNENYLESDQFPNGSFKGTISGAEGLDLSKNEERKVKLSGTMNIHGTERKIEEEATLIVKDGKLSLKCNFSLKPEDYNVRIPAGKKGSISETLALTVLMNYEKK